MEDFKSEIVDKLKGLKEEIVKENRYEKLKLRFNPFPPAAIAQYTHFDPVDESIKQQIEYFIKVTYQKGENEEIGEYAGLTIIGEYGYGKTHLMKYIEGIIKTLNGEKEIDFTALTTFIDKPEDEPQNIIHKIVEDLEPDNLRRLIWAAIHPHILSIHGREDFIKNYVRLTILTNQNFDELFEIPVLSNPLIFYEKFRAVGGDVRKFQEKVRAIINEVIVDDNTLANRYINLIFPEKRVDSNWDILTGYISSKDVQSKEVKFLNSIIKVLRDNGYNMLYVFIDEFEDLGKLKGAKLTNYINTLNTMINRQRKWAVIVSLTQEALDVIKAESPPLYDRIATVEVRLKPLTLDTAKKLIQKYIEYAKIEGNDSIHFTDELLEEMLRRSEGNYRSFIKLANKAVEFSLDEDITNEIPARVLEKVTF